MAQSRAAINHSRSARQVTFNTVDDSTVNLDSLD